MSNSRPKEGSLGLPRWRTCQIPDPEAATNCQNPYSGEGFLNQMGCLLHNTHRYLGDRM